LSRRFLTPVNLPHGSSLPAVGSVGDLFYNTSDSYIYSHSGSVWARADSASAGSLSDLSDTTLANPVGGDTLLYDEASSKWININFAEVLANFGLYSGDGGSYNTTEFTGTMDGGSHNTTLFMSVVDGGNEGSS
jgi:hypothetical protein